MSSLTRPRVRRTREFACKQLDWRTIEVNGQEYQVEVIPAGEVGSAAIRLVKHAADGAVYDVVRDHDGLVRCDCPSYVVTHEGTSSTCKHGRALVQLGLLKAPGPFIPPPPFEVEAGAIRRAAGSTDPDPASPAGDTASDDADGDDDDQADDVDPARLPLTLPADDPEGDSADDDDATPDWSLDDVVGLGPEPDEPRAPRLPLDELAALQASWFRSWGTDAGDLFAEHFDLLVANLKCCATPGRPLTPDQYRGRIEALEDFYADR